MPRRDLTEERTAQILDAFEACILRDGLGSSSLEKVAEEAGVKRPIIRHYIGNRDELIIALTARLIETFRSDTYSMLISLGTGDRIKKMVNILMAMNMETSAETVLVFENLVLASLKMESVRELLADWTTEFVASIKKELVNAYPNGKGHAEVAYGIVSIYYNHISLMPLQLPASMQNSGKKAVFRLIESLNDE